MSETFVVPVLGREAILSAADIQTEQVMVPEWGGAVLVRGLTGAERDAFEASVVVPGSKGGGSVRLEMLRAKLCARSIVDEQGARVFSDADVKALGAKSAAALQRVFNVAMRLSGLSDQDVESLAAGLKNDPSAGSTSD